MWARHSRFKAVLFDLGGTLIKTSPVAETLRRILKEYGIQKTLQDVAAVQEDIDRHLSLDDYALSSDEFWFRWNMEILERLGALGNLQHLAMAIGEKWWDYADLDLFPDVIGTLTYLRTHGYKIGLVTNGFKSDIDAILPRVGLSGYFDVAVGVDAVRKPKPNREIFLFALDVLAVRPYEAIYVGDMMEADYEGAEKAGLTAVLIDRERKIDSNVRKIENLDEIKRLLE